MFEIGPNDTLINDNEDTESLFLFSFYLANVVKFDDSINFRLLRILQQTLT